tara:strand:- start:152 stop:502 length:351 start_codon:yes stop_codon:yes gene_type:complete
MSDRYTEITKSKDVFNQIDIYTHIPTPRDVDYTNGFITRFFIQKTNDVNSLIYEVKERSYGEFKQSSQYVAISLDWRVTGTFDEIKKSNKASILIETANIPKIGLYLPNLLQFHKK